MAGTDLRWEDWEHRIGLLSAWRYWRRPWPAEKAREGDRETYSAVIDGCAITIRALCDILDVRCKFDGFQGSEPGDPRRLQHLFSHVKSGHSMLTGLPSDEERLCLLEVLFLGNRAVAHPKDGTKLDHGVRGPEMTSAINTVLTWLDLRRNQWPALKSINQQLFTPIDVK